MKISKYNFEFKKSGLVKIPQFIKEKSLISGKNEYFICWLWFVIVIKDIYYRLLKYNQY